MKKKLALIFLAVGIVCLILYLILVFKTTISVLILLSLFTSIACNAAALNLFFSIRGERRRTEDD